MLINYIGGGKIGDMNYNAYARQRGFTIVELLIVIVVIGVLAGISIVAYNGVTAKARDSQRAQDMKTIAKALEMYYVDNGRYPASGCGSTCPSPKKINSSWATTSDGSWAILESALVPKYISALPRDPRASTATNSAIDGGYNYDYVITGSWCSATSGQLYLLTYQLEGSGRKTDITGDCPGTQVTAYSSSRYIVVK